MKNQICIIDYGAGNIGSIANMINYVGGNYIISNKISDLQASQKLILPGVGHFDFGMKKLIESDLIHVLNDLVHENNIPILGICLGAQLMTEFSEEGNLKGLGWFNANVKKFKRDQIRVPHMGWNYVESKKTTNLNSGFDTDYRFYFVHSYYINPLVEEDVLFESQYGTKFCSGLNRGNIYGVQFHPEKSHKYGIHLMKNFISI